MVSLWLRGEFFAFLSKKWSLGARASADQEWSHGAVRCGARARKTSRVQPLRGSLGSKPASRAVSMENSGFIPEEEIELSSDHSIQILGKSSGHLQRGG